VRALVYAGSVGLSPMVLERLCLDMWTAIVAQYEGTNSGVDSFLAYFGSTWMTRPGGAVTA